MSLDLLKHIEKPLYIMEVSHALGVHREFFTKIPWAEYRRIRHAQKILSIPEPELEMQIFRDYVVPKGKYSLDDIRRMPAGVISSVVSVIMELSDSSTFPGSNGEIPLEDLTLRVNAQRYMVATQLDLQMMTTICAVFKGYTFESLGKLSFDKIIQLFAAAERHLLNIGAIGEPLEFSRLSDNQEEQEEPNKSELEEALEEADEASSIDKDMDLIKQYAAMDKVRKQEPKPEPKPEPEPELEKPGLVVSTSTLPDPYKVKPASVSETNPHRQKLAELEKERIRNIEKARASGRSQRTDFVRHSQEYTDANGIKVPTPGINHAGGIRKDDFEGVNTMTDEQAMEFAISDGLFPAGYEIIIKKEEAQKEKSANTLEEEIKKRVGNKRLTLRQRKILKDQLKEEGFLE